MVFTLLLCSLISSKFSLNFSWTSLSRYFLNYYSSFLFFSSSFSWILNKYFRDRSSFILFIASSLVYLRVFCFTDRSDSLFSDSRWCCSFIISIFLSFSSSYYLICLWKLSKIDSCFYLSLSYFFFFFLKISIILCFSSDVNDDFSGVLLLLLLFDSLRIAFLSYSYFSYSSWSSYNVLCFDSLICFIKLILWSWCGGYCLRKGFGFSDIYNSP